MQFKITRSLKFFLLLFTFIYSFARADSSEKPKVFGKSEIFIPLGHTRAITSVAFSPDGKYALSGSWDNTIRLWDIETGKEIRTFVGHKHYVTSVSFSPDGKYALSGSQDKTIKLWDIQKGEMVITFIGHTDSVTSVAFSPDGKHIISGSVDNTIRLWDIETGKGIKTLSGPEGHHISSVAFSPDGKYILSGSYDQTMKIWDMEAGEEIRTFIGHTDSVTSVAFSPDGKYALSGGRDKIVKLWNIKTGKTIRTFSDHKCPVFSVAFSPDGKYVLSGSWDKTVKLWNIETGKTIRTFEGHKSPVYSVAFSPDGKYVLSGSDDHTMKLWDIETGTQIKTFSGHTNTVSPLAISPDGKYVLSGSDDHTIKLWDIETGTQIRTFSGHIDSITSIAFSPDGKYLLSGSMDNSMKLWDIEKGKEIKSFSGHILSVTSVAFSPDGKYVLSGSRDTTVKLWDIETGKIIRTFKGHKHPVFSVAFSQDGKYSISGSLYDTIKFWDIETGKEIRSCISNDKYHIFSIAFSPDGKYALSGRWDTTIKLLNINKGCEIRTFKGHNGIVGSVAFSPDGKYALSGSWDNTIKLWDIKTGKEIRTFIGHTGSVNSVFFSADGKFIISGSVDGTIRFWNINTGREIVRMFYFTKDEWIIITPDGYYNASANGDRYLRVRIGNNIYSIEKYREKYYRPDLVIRSLAGVSPQVYTKIYEEKLPPSVEIIDTPNKVQTDELKLKLKITDRGGGIGDIRIMLNEVGVPPEYKRLIGKESNSVFYECEIRLVPGQNIVKAIVFNDTNSGWSEIEYNVRCLSNRRIRKPSLYAVVVGISEFEESSSKLENAGYDAHLIADTLENRAKLLFEKIKIKTLVKKEETTKDNILNTLENYKFLNPYDVFIFYISSHGQVINGEYLLITSNVSSRDPNKIIEDAINQKELRTILYNIPTTKKLFIFDTCFSGQIANELNDGVILKSLSSDEISMKTAMKLLSNAVGAPIYASSKKDQTSIMMTSKNKKDENYSLFTYVLAKGLNGEADSNNDRYIFTDELGHYVCNQTKTIVNTRFRDKPQEPVFYPGSISFPIAVIR